MVKKLIALIFITLAASLIWLSYSNLPQYHIEVPEDFRIEISNDVSIYEGKRIAMTICKHCHFNYETESLAGRHHGNPKKFGKFFSGNITNDTLSGIGAWTNEELYILLRTGIKRDGTLVFDMPRYPLLSETDMQSLIAFLRSDDPLVRPSSYKNPPAEFSILTKALQKFWFRPIKWDWSPVRTPDFSDPISLGKYLVNAKFSCFDCHSGNALLNDYSDPPSSWHYLRGQNPHVDEVGNTIYSQPLIPVSANYNKASFSSTIRTGKRPNGTLLRDPMIPFPVITEEEADAIYDYLYSLEINEH